jgi:acylphosphatase
VVVCGTDEALLELEQWLWQGPPAARVDDVARSDWDSPVAHGFAVG